MNVVRQLATRVATCGQRLGAPDLRRGDRSVAFHGVATCGSVWACPVCASALRACRSEEICEAATKHMKDRNGGLLFLTLTVRHNNRIPLYALLDVLCESWKKFQSYAAWKGRCKELGVLGQIKAVEVTWSASDGWHPHLHMILFTERCLTEEEVAHLRTVLVKSVKKRGRPSKTWSDVVRGVADRFLYRFNRWDGEESRFDLKVFEEEVEADGDPGTKRVVRHFRVIDRMVERLVWAESEDEPSKGSWKERVSRAEELVKEWNARWRERDDWARNLTADMFVPDAEHGVDMKRVDKPAGVSCYISKIQDEGHRSWGLGAELTRGDVKDGRSGDGEDHLVPMQFLDDDCPGGLSAKVRQSLWGEFVRATQGRNALTWSRGLKERFGISEVSDEDVLEQASEHIMAVWAFTNEDYDEVRRDPVRMAAAVNAMREGDYDALAGILPGWWDDAPDDALIAAEQRKTVTVPAVGGIGLFVNGRRPYAMSIDAGR